MSQRCVAIVIVMLSVNMLRVVMLSVEVPWSQLGQECIIIRAMGVFLSSHFVINALQPYDRQVIIRNFVNVNAVMLSVEVPGACVKTRPCTSGVPLKSWIFRPVVISYTDVWTIVVASLRKTRLSLPGVVHHGEAAVGDVHCPDLANVGGN
jgi:hypothetical protein